MLAEDDDVTPCESPVSETPNRPIIPTAVEESVNVDLNVSTPEEFCVGITVFLF